MTERARPAGHEVAVALATALGVPGPDVVVGRVRDLSPGLGPACVLSVDAQVRGERMRVIAKVPGWGHQSLLGLTDPALARREAEFYTSPVPGALPKGLRVPAVLATVEHGGHTWLWLEDVSAALVRRWRPHDMTTVARRLALLPSVDAERAPWLERRGWAAYRHHIPAAQENLAAGGLFDAEETAALQGILDAEPHIGDVLDGLPTTFVHGDCNLRNLGFDGDDLVLVDWEHVGVGPCGSDLAAVICLYRLFGGTGELDEEALLAVHTEALPGSPTAEEVRLGYAGWHLTWALHLRLGPGLRALRDGLHGTDPDDARPHRQDIVDGARRALRFAPLFGIEVPA